MQMTENGILIQKDDWLYEMLAGYLTSTVIGLDPDYLKRQGLHSAPTVHIGTTSRMTGVVGQHMRQELFYSVRDQQYSIDQSIISHNSPAKRQIIAIHTDMPMKLITHYFQRLLDERLSNARPDHQ